MRWAKHRGKTCQKGRIWLFCGLRCDDTTVWVVISDSLDLWTESFKTIHVVHAHTNHMHHGLMFQQWINKKKKNPTPTHLCAQHWQNYILAVMALVLNAVYRVIRKCWISVVATHALWVGFLTHTPMVTFIFTTNSNWCQVQVKERWN